MGTSSSSAPFSAASRAGSGNQMSWQMSSATLPKSVSKTGTESPGMRPAAASEMGSCTLWYLPAMFPLRSMRTAVLKSTSPARSTIPNTRLTLFARAIPDMKSVLGPGTVSAFVSKVPGAPIEFSSSPSTITSGWLATATCPA